MNKLLQRQLRKHPGASDKLIGNLSKLLTTISESYDRYEKDHKVIESSMELSSKEMIELNAGLKKENEELKKAHKELKILLDGIDEVLYSVDMVSFKLLQMSAACEKVYGYTSREFFDDVDLWQKVIHPEDKHIAEQHVATLYEGKQVLNQYRIIHKDKSIRWLENKIIPALDETGRLVRMDGVSNDITKRKQTEKELEASISILEATIESTADGILVADFNGKIIRFNKKFAELTRLPREILDEKDDEKAIAFVLNQLINPEEFLAKVKELYVQQNDVSFDILKFKDGRIIERYSQPQLINGNCVGRVWSFRDTTERKKSEDKVKESELRYRSLIEQSTDTICIIDTTLKFSDINPSGCQMFGYLKEEVLQLSLTDVLSNQELKNNPLKIEDLKSGKTIYNERRVKRKDGVVIEIELSGKMLEDGRIIVFGRDISERKKAEQKLIATSGALQQALNDLNKIMDSSLDVICAVDEKGYFLQVSAACETIWGYKADELIGKLMIDFVYPEDRGKTQAAAMKVIAGNNMINFENRYIRKDGSLVPINWSARWDAKERIRYGVARDATEKKRSEEALENQRKRYNDLFLQAPSCIGVVRGPNHVYEMANPLYLQLIGKRDIIGKPVKEAVPEVVEQGFIQILDEVYNTGKTFSVNEMLVKLVGTNGNLSDVYLNFICQAYRNNEGNVDGIFFFAIDITEQVLSRKKIEESELRFRSLVEQATDAICITDASMKFIDINPYGLGMFGYTLEEGLQLSLPDILFKEDLVANPIKLNELKLGKTTRNERRLKRKDGTAIDMAVSTKLMENGSLIMFGHDITERKKAEQAIRASEETRKLIMNSALDAIVGMDSKGCITVWTPQAEKIFGWKEEEVIGKTMAEIIIPSQYRERHQQGLERYLQTGKGIILNKLNELSALNREGKEFPIEISIIPIKQGDTAFFCAFIRDITERKNAETLLQKSQASLAINNHLLEQKNKELEQFAYVASHDMQEPLRTTSSFIELLQKQYKGKLDENADKYLTFISQSSDRMKVLIKDLLDYSRIGRKKELAEVDCNIMLNEVLADLGKAINEAHAEIKADDLPVISGYPTEIKQLFQNLLINAIKFRKRDTIPEINICVQKNGSYWEFAVKDNGIGMDEQYRERIFIIFQRLHTRNEYEGSGIGLAHCKKIVELHGGRIWVESKPGEGCTFHFTVLDNHH